jgi:GNAT superfamily N-acetyltransferase
MNKTIRFFEELTMNAFPALKTQLYDGWVLRFSNGYCGRGNSVFMHHTSKLCFEEKIKFCERLYTAQGLPTLFKMTRDSSAGLEEHLKTRGYQTEASTHVFACDAPPTLEIHRNVSITRELSPQWKADYFRLSNTNPAMIPTASAMMDNIQGNVFCAKIMADGKTVACGYCVEERGCAGLYSIVVDPAYRGRGLGAALCESLMAAASNEGAASFYLQVETQNAPAIALYRKLGFALCYDYYYMKKDQT